MTRLHWSKRVGKREVLVEPPPLPRGTEREIEYSARQTQLGRPVSPHLTVYKQSIPAIASITSRVCGIALSLGFGAAAAAATAGYDIPSLIFRAQDAVPGFVYVSKFAVAFPLTYHWLTGTRHFLWNSQPGLINMRFAPRSSAAMLAAAVLVASGATAYSIEAPVPASPTQHRRPQ